MKKFRSTAAMVAVALLWGGAFSAQSAGLRHMEALAFTATRLFVATLALVVVTALFDLVRSANAAIAAAEQFSAAEVLAVFKRMDEVLGVVFFEKAAKEDVPAEIQALLDARAAARKERNWAESDRLRDEIAAAGWAVKDSKDGQTVTKR